MSAIHANKERCPTMHFPSVVHLAPRRNDLFDVYSRSLTLIKITAGPSFASLFLSLSLSLFWGSFACIASFLLRFTLRRSKGLPSGMGTEPPSGFSLFTPCSCSAERDPCSYFARGSSYTGCPRNHGAKISFLGFNEISFHFFDVFFHVLWFRRHFVRAIPIYTSWSMKSKWENSLRNLDRRVSFIRCSSSRFSCYTIILFKIL